MLDVRVTRMDAAGALRCDVCVLLAGAGMAFVEVRRLLVDGQVTVRWPPQQQSGVLAIRVF